MNFSQKEFSQPSALQFSLQRSPLWGHTRAPTVLRATSIAKQTAEVIEGRLPVVVLVHGILNGFRTMVPLANSLKNAGRATLLAQLTPNLGQLPIEEYALQLKGFIDSKVEHGARIDLVGFSMGGLVSQTFIQLLEGHSRVRKFVSIAAPHQGTLWAHLATAAGIVDMRCGSAHLKRLSNMEHLLDHIEITTIRTPYDGVIIPSSSSELARAANRVVPVLAHPALLRNEDVHRLVIQGLS